MCSVRTRHAIICGSGVGGGHSRCTLYFLIEDNAENKTRALHAGAKRLAKAALKAHPRNKRVVREAQDLLTHIE
jgi:hypothetical protein